MPRRICGSSWPSTTARCCKPCAGSGCCRVIPTCLDRRGDPDDVELVRLDRRCVVARSSAQRGVAGGRSVSGSAPTPLPSDGAGRGGGTRPAVELARRSPPGGAGGFDPVSGLRRLLPPAHQHPPPGPPAERRRVQAALRLQPRPAVDVRGAVPPVYGSRGEERARLTHPRAPDPGAARAAPPGRHAHDRAGRAAHAPRRAAARPRHVAHVVRAPRARRPLSRSRLGPAGSAPPPDAPREAPPVVRPWNSCRTGADAVYFPQGFPPPRSTFAL